MDRGGSRRRSCWRVCWPAVAPYVSCWATRATICQAMNVLQDAGEWEEVRNWDPDARVCQIRCLGGEVADVERLCTALVYRRAAALNKLPLPRSWADQATLQGVMDSLGRDPDFVPSYLDELDPSAVKMMGEGCGGA